MPIIPKILIVDDKPQNLYALELLLRDTDAAVFRAESGDEALGLTLNHDFALAIVDVQMPGMDGYELVEFLRANPGTAQIPVIFVSAAYSDEQHQFKGYETGAVDYIVKPFDPAVLMGKVRVFLELAHYRMNLETIIEERTRKSFDTNKLLKMVVELSTSFLNLPINADINGEVERALGRAAHSIDADRAYLFTLSKDGDFADNTHEWCGKGIAPEKDLLQEVSIEKFSWALEQFKTNNAIVINDCDALPPAAREEKQMMLDHGVGSVLLVALRFGRVLRGFIGFDAVNRKRVWPDAGGELLLMLGNVITSAMNRHATVNTLRESEERFRNVATMNWVWETDPHGCYTYSSAMVEDLLGYPIHEVLGRTALDFMREAEANRVGPILRRFSASRKAILEMEHIKITKDGREVHLQTTGVPMWGPNGQLVGYRGMDKDVSERKNLEGQLLQAQKMEWVGRLAGGVAHDFNNMLGVIFGNAEMAIARIEASQPAHGYLEEILKAAERSATLTRQLLAFARKQPVMPEVLNINESVEDVLKLLRRLVGENIRIVWEPGDHTWTVNLDPSQLDQMLANLCVNARDAITDNGEIRIETGYKVVDDAYCAEHRELEVGEYVTVSVSDNGCGMDTDTVSHIFEPFFTTKETGKGTGLGLATVYGAVRQNKGYIEVGSIPGTGTRFTIYLPRYTGEGKRAEKDDLGPIIGGNETILVTEDEAKVLKTTMLILENLGYKVLSATSAEDAIRVATEYEGDIHLLLTDVVMPGTNGKELALNLTATYPKIKCLFMSGYPDDIIARHGVLDAGVDFIRKPCSTDELALKVRRALEHDRHAGIIGAEKHELAPGSTRDALARMSTGVIEDMREAVDEGDMTRFTELLLHVEEVDAAAARTLKALAARYEYDTLGECLAMHEVDHG